MINLCNFSNEKELKLASWTFIFETNFTLVVWDSNIKMIYFTFLDDVTCFCLENYQFLVLRRSLRSFLVRLNWFFLFLLSKSCTPTYTARRRRDFRQSLVGFPLHVLWIRFPLWQNRILGPTKLNRKWKRPNKWKFFVQIEAGIDYLRTLFVFTYWQHLFKTLSLLFELKKIT